MSDTFTRDLKFKCYEIAAASNYPQNGPDVIKMASSAFNWITGASDKNENPNGKEAHIHMNIGGVADENSFRHKKSTPDSSEECSASKPEEAKIKENGSEINLELHQLPECFDVSDIIEQFFIEKSKDPFVKRMTERTGMTLQEIVKNNSSTDSKTYRGPRLSKLVEDLIAFKRLQSKNDPLVDLSEQARQIIKGNLQALVDSI